MKFTLTIISLASIGSLFFQYYLHFNLIDDIKIRNELILKNIHLKDTLLLCKSFYKNTTYVNKNDCKVIQNGIKDIEDKLNRDFSFVDIYINIKS